MNNFSNDNLQMLCLKVIACNFDRLYVSIFTSSDEHVQTSIKVLQKFYSDRLLILLSQSNYLKNEHLTFIINKYLKQLDLRYVNNCNPFTIEERLEDVGNVITTFAVAGILKYNLDRLLGHLTKLQILDLAKTNCSDKTITVISENCSALKSLDLNGCAKVTDKGLAVLCEKGPPLEILNIEYTSVSYKGVALVLQKIHTLVKLQFDNVPRAIFEAKGLNEALTIKDNRVFNLSNLVILNNPMRPENHLTAILNVCTVSCPKVKDIVVREIITEEQLSLVSTFKNLEVVHLQCSTIVSKLCINGFLNVRGDKITVLSLTFFALSVELLAKACPNLEYLALQYPTFQQVMTADFGFPCLKFFNLQNASLEIAENQISSTCIISSSPNLTELHIVCCQFSEEMREVVLNYPKNLSVLNFSHTIVSTDFMEEILRVHTGLRELILDNSGISSADYDDLMDIVDDMESKLFISCADYSEAIRELFNYDDSMFNNMQKRYILKL